jgi:2-amino-4-hydroxy-6-hydroxymethyldihydropteridine diphosphokinase
MNTAERQSVYLGLGSNLGDRQAFLQEALGHIGRLPGTRLLRSSSIYETDPWGETDQGRFYNAVVEIETSLQPEALLTAVKDIEAGMGRESTRRNGPRIIDIDILLYGSEIMTFERLDIPHPGLADRQFVLTPLRELAGGMQHPVSLQTIDEMARHCPDTGNVRKTDVHLQCC